MVYLSHNACLDLQMLKQGQNDITPTLILSHLIMYAWWVFLLVLTNNIRCLLPLLQSTTHCISLFIEQSFFPFQNNSQI